MSSVTFRAGVLKVCFRMTLPADFTWAERREEEGEEEEKKGSVERKRKEGRRAGGREGGRGGHSGRPRHGPPSLLPSRHLPDFHEPHLREQSRVDRPQRRESIRPERQGGSFPPPKGWRAFIQAKAEFGCQFLKRQGSCQATNTAADDSHVQYFGVVIRKRRGPGEKDGGG